MEKYQQNILQDLVELWADNHHLEVRLASLGHIVHVGLVDDLAKREWPNVLIMVQKVLESHLQVLRLEPLSELGPDGGRHSSLLSCHGEPVLQCWSRTHSLLLTCLLSSNDQAYQTSPVSQRLPFSKDLRTKSEYFASGARCLF